jgi:hypothetical protein
MPKRAMGCRAGSMVPFDGQVLSISEVAVSKSLSDGNVCGLLVGRQDQFRWKAIVYQIRHIEPGSVIVTRPDS